MIDQYQVVQTVRGYLRAAIWASDGPDGRPLDGRFRIEDFTGATFEATIGEVQAFLRSAEKELEAIGGQFHEHGIDLWLSRNGHGSGFFDRGDGPAYARLQAIAGRMGKRHVQETGDGRLEIVGGP